VTEMWQYRTEIFQEERLSDHRSNCDMVINRINALGREGWRMIGHEINYADNPPVWWCLFEREVSSGTVRMTVRD